jgi:hypothetical protein
VTSSDAVADGGEGEGDDFSSMVGGDQTYDRLWPL